MSRSSLSMLLCCLVYAAWADDATTSPAGTADAGTQAASVEDTSSLLVNNNGQHYAVLRVVQNILSSEACNMLCQDDNKCVAADYGSNAIGESGRAGSGKSDFIADDRTCVQYTATNANYQVECTAGGYTRIKTVPDVASSDDCFDLCTKQARCVTADYGEPKKTSGNFQDKKSNFLTNGDKSCIMYGKCTTPAPTPVPAIDCTVSGWGDWDYCSKTCGGGSQTRARTVVSKPEFGGLACPYLSMTQGCATNPCPVPYVVMHIPAPPPPKRGCEYCPFLLVLLLPLAALVWCCVTPRKPIPPQAVHYFKNPEPGRWWEATVPAVKMPRVDMRDLDPRIQERICNAIELMMCDHSIHTVTDGGRTHIKGTAPLIGASVTKESEFVMAFSRGVGSAASIRPGRVHVDDVAKTAEGGVTVHFTIRSASGAAEMDRISKTLQSLSQFVASDSTGFFKKYPIRTGESFSVRTVQGGHAYQEGQEPINEYLRLAEMYDTFCTSGEEHFISWLRLHVFEFEQLLRRADMELARLALAHDDYKDTHMHTWEQWGPESEEHPLHGKRSADFGDPRRIVKEISSGVFEVQAPLVNRMPDKSLWAAPLPPPGHISCPYWDWSRPNVGDDGSPTRYTIRGDDDYVNVQYHADLNLRGTRPLERSAQFSRLQDLDNSKVVQEREGFVPKMLRERFELFRHEAIYEPNPTSNVWRLKNPSGKPGVERLCPWSESPKFTEAFRLEANDAEKEGQSMEWLLPDQQVMNNITQLDAAGQVQAALSMWEHWMFASTRWKGAGGASVNPREARQALEGVLGGLGLGSSGAVGNSIEEPCNAVHLAVGHPLQSIPTAAFHPLFFLIHCNIDRYYEAWLHAPSPDHAIAGTTRRQQAEAEFRAVQTRLQDEAQEVNRYESWLRPFRYMPVGDIFEAAPPLRQGKYLLPFHTFSIARLNYRYDNLPQTATEVGATTDATRSFFANFTIDVRQLRRQSFQLHVFLLSAEQAEDFNPMGDEGDANDLHRLTANYKQYYAGMASVYGGKDTADVGGSTTRRPYRVKVDLSRVLALHKAQGREGLADLRLRTWVVNANAPQKLWSKREGGFSLLEATIGLEPPIVMGPLFEGDIKDGELRWESTKFNKARLQRYLLKYGYYKESTVMQEPSVEQSGEVGEGSRSPGMATPKKLLGGGDDTPGAAYSPAAASSSPSRALQTRPVHSADHRASSSTGYLGTNEFVGDMIGDMDASNAAVALFNTTFSLTGGSSPEANAASMAVMTRIDGLPDFNLYDNHRGPSLSQGPEGMTRNPNNQPNYQDGTTVTWYLDTTNTAPAYIPNSDTAVQDAARRCFQLWNAALQQCGLNVAFKQEVVSKKGSANIRINWQDRSDDNLLAWSGAGGELAYASANSIILDMAQRWRVRGASGGTQNPLTGSSERELHRCLGGPGLSPILEDVLMHEIGHCLGLGHSPHPEDVMFPYYNAIEGSEKPISDSDKQQLRQMFGR